MERVLTARLRDARFFFDADREQPLASYTDRLGTVLFHKKLGSYQEKAARVETLARWICADVFGTADLADHAAEAGRLCKADLATDMVRELTELQGTMGGIYAREDGRPEEVWKAIYYHYLPVGVEADAPPTKEQLGAAAITWAAVALADKLDTLVSMFAAGERPTGSRDPYGLRRAAQGLVRILIDLPELTGIDRGLALGPLVDRAGEPVGRHQRRLARAARCVPGRPAALRARAARRRRAQRARRHPSRRRGAGAAVREAPAGRAARVHRHRGVPRAGHGVQARAQHREDDARRGVRAAGARRGRLVAGPTPSRRRRPWCRT